MTDSGMADLISRAAAIDALTDKNIEMNFDSVYDGEIHRTKRAAIRIVANLPTVDAVPVVRCKDCLYWKSDMLTHFWKPCDVINTDKDWYCPCGKRR